MEKAQCYLMGTVADQPKTFITNVSVTMSHDFCRLMQQILKEANENKFTTKGEIVQRRDELVAETSPAATARTSATANIAAARAANSDKPATPKQLQQKTQNS